MEQKDNFEKFLDRYFEGVFFKFRYLALIAVVFSLLGSVALFLIGGYEITHSILDFIKTHAAKDLELGLINGIDIFLFALIMMIFSMGVYDLFVSKLEPSHIEGARPAWIIFKNIDELKGSLAKVVVIILLITFFELVITMAPGFKNSYELLVIPIGIVLIAWGIKLLH